MLVIRVQGLRFIHDETWSRHFRTRTSRFPSASAHHIHVPGLGGGKTRPTVKNEKEIVPDANEKPAGRIFSSSRHAVRRIQHPNKQAEEEEAEEEEEEEETQSLLMRLLFIHTTVSYSAVFRIGLNISPRDFLPWTLAPEKMFIEVKARKRRGHIIEASSFSRLFSLENLSHRPKFPTPRNSYGTFDRLSNQIKAEHARPLPPPPISCFSHEMSQGNWRWTIFIVIRIPGAPERGGGGKRSPGRPNLCLHGSGQSKSHNRTVEWASRRIIN